MDNSFKQRPEKDLPIVPLSIEEVEIAARKRVSLIDKEFRAGLEFIKNYPTSVTIFGSARLPEDNPFYIKARHLAGRIVSELNYSIVTGGGPGIMEAGNRGAHEKKGTSVGITIKLPHEQVTNSYVQHSVDFYYFFVRKVIMTYAAEAYIFFPGGFGTIDEFSEILTLVQTKKIKRVPIILVGSEFWNPFKEVFEKEMLKRGTIDEHDLSLFTITDDENEILEIIKSSPIRTGIPYNHTDDTRNPDALLHEQKCISCGHDDHALDEIMTKELTSKVVNWLVIENKKITKSFVFDDFNEAIDFVNEVADIAEIEEHHPDISLFDYKNVRVSLSTHEVGGLSKNDFIMAAKIDELKK